MRLLKWCNYLVLVVVLFFIFSISAAGQNGPEIDINKYTNGEDANEAPGPFIPVGDPVEWRYEVTYSGIVELHDVEVSDNQLGPICSVSQLPVGASMICYAYGTAQAGQYENIGTVDATAPDGSKVEDSDASHYFGGPATIDMEKYTNGEDADEAPGPIIPVGDPVEWRYEVTNSGDVELHDVAVSDNQLGPICSVSQFPGGASMICYAYGTAQAGQYENIGTVVAITLDKTRSEDSDSSHYFGGSAAIDMEKSTNGEDADEAPGPFIPPGEPVKWEYVVKNIGNVELTEVTVTDDQGVSVDCTEDSLQPGESMICTAEGLAEAGQYENIGMVVATADGSKVEDSDASHYFGELAVPVDIKPGSCPNPLNTKSKGKLPVAILGTDSFDVRQIDPSTVRLEGVTPIRWSLDDVGTPFDPLQDKEDCYTDCNELGPDGFTDLTLKFKRQAVLEALGDVDDRDCLVLTVTGNLKDEYGGASIMGEDVLLILKKGKKNGKKKNKKNK